MKEVLLLTLPRAIPLRILFIVWIGLCIKIASKLTINNIEEWLGYILIMLVSGIIYVIISTVHSNWSELGSFIMEVIVGTICTFVVFMLFLLFLCLMLCMPYCFNA